MRTTLFLAIALALAVTGSAEAQVEARQATAADLQQEELVEVPSPMLLEIPLGASETRKSLGDPTVSGRTYYDTKKFVCDKARVKLISVMKRPADRGGLDVEIMPMVSTGWPRQDIDLTVALIGADGKEVRKKVWDDLTVGADDSALNKWGGLIGPIASSTKRPQAKFSFGRGEFEALFQGEAQPRLRVIVDIQE